MNEIANIFGHTLDPRSNLPSTELADETTYVGVEIELENLTVPHKSPIFNHPFWEIHYDDSLRGSSAEFRLKLPLKGRDLIQSLHSLHGAIFKLKDDPITSDRTSTHIHIDARQLTSEQLYNWIICSIIFERVLYNYAGEKRSKSIFCVPFYAGTKPLLAVGILIQATSNEDIFLKFRHQFSEDFRYSGINLNALLKFGSIEFRMLDGEWRKDRLLLWINTLLAIRNFSINLETPISKWVDKLIYGDTINEIKKVLGDTYEVIKYPEIKDHIISGCRIANEVLKSKDNMSVSWELLRLSSSSMFNRDYLKKFKAINEYTEGSHAEKKSVSKKKKPNLGNYDMESFTLFFNPPSESSIEIDQEGEI